MQDALFPLSHSSDGKTISVINNLISTRKRFIDGK